VSEGSIEDKATIAAISVLAERSADRIEDEVRKALSKKGFSDRLIKAACEHVHEQFVGEVKEVP
jgi:SOS response regulatory protein OraA/RecX